MNDEFLKKSLLIGFFKSAFFFWRKVCLKNAPISLAYKQRKVHFQKKIVAYRPFVYNTMLIYNICKHI